MLVLKNRGHKGKLLKNTVGYIDTPVTHTYSWILHTNSLKLETTKMRFINTTCRLHVSWAKPACVRPVESLRLTSAARIKGTSF